MDTTDVIFQATGTAGNDYFTPSNANSTLCGGSRFWYYCYAPGANISIAGAGTGGAALTTQITGTNGLVIYIGNNLATTVSGANVTWQGGGAAIRER